MSDAAEGKKRTRESFARVSSIETRWMDNDVYGHVNNVVYYSLFDTVINRYLIDQGSLDIFRGAVIGLAVETGCSFYRPLHFPQIIEAALCVAHLGRSSVRYEVGLFARGESEIAALGRFTHVFVDRDSRTPTAIDGALRAALAALRVS